MDKIGRKATLRGEDSMYVVIIPVFKDSRYSKSAHLKSQAPH